MGLEKKKILFVCTGNAGRSQMAEALLRDLTGDQFNIQSAGVEPWEELESTAVRIISERGIDMSGQKPKHVNTMVDQSFDLVVTIGSPALEHTPELFGNPIGMHWDIDDPAESMEEAAFRKALSSIENKMPEIQHILGHMTFSSDVHLLPGVSTCVFSEFKPAEHLPIAVKAGIKVLDLGFWRGSTRYPWDQLDKMIELKQIIDDLGLKVHSVHTMKDISPYNALWHRKFSIDMFKVFADLAVEMGAQVLVTHGSLPSATPTQQEKDDFFDALKELEHHVLSMPCKYGWENDVIGLTPKEHIEMLRRLKPSAFGFTLDNGHSYIHSDTDEYIELAGRRLCSLHIQDNDGKGDEHKFPGEGTFPWKGFVTKLVNAGYTGPLMLEPNDPRPEQDLYESLKRGVDALKEMRAEVL